MSTARPERTTLLDNYPNPFNPETWIPYQLQTPARAAWWDGRDQRGEQVAGGVYLYRLQAGSFAEAGKMVLLK